MFEWQRRVLAKACAVDAADKFIANRVTLVCPRRNGKTALVLARVLAECLFWSTRERPATVLYTAHLGDTARHVFTDFLDLLNSSKWLQDQTARVGYGKGDESIRFHNGAKFHIRARTNAGGRGLECTTLILDEALELKPDHVAALTPLLAKAQARGIGQLWMLSSAGYGKSVVLAGVRDKGRATTDPTSVYFEWAAPREADPADPVTWHMANPSLGTSILVEAGLRSQFDTMTLEDFGREHLGWWTDQKADPLLPHGSWELCAMPAPVMPPKARVALGFEMQKDRTAVLVAAVALGKGRVWVEPVERWHTTDRLDPQQIAGDVRRHMKRLRAVTVAGSEYSAGSVLDHVEAYGGHVTRHNISHVLAASQTLLNGVTGGRVLHPTELDSQTESEIVNAGKAKAGDGLSRLSRTNSTGSSASAFAVASAVHVIIGPGPGRPAIVTGAA